MITVAVANQKGGVGKTAVAHALGSELARRGRRVLLVDNDPQASLTAACGIEAAGASIADVYEGRRPAEDTIRSVAPGLDLLPSDIALAHTELVLIARLGRENVLVRALHPIGGRYDLALVDCPPALGMLTINALTAAAGVLIPVQPQAADLRGLRLFLATVEETRAELNPQLQIVGIVPTFHDPRLLHHAEAIDVMTGAGLPVTAARIGRSVRVAEAAAAEGSIVDFEPGHKISGQIAQLANEVIAWVENAGS